MPCQALFDGSLLRSQQLFHPVSFIRYPVSCQFSFVCSFAFHDCSSLYTSFYTRFPMIFGSHLNFRFLQGLKIENYKLLLLERGT